MQPGRCCLHHMTQIRPALSRVHLLHLREQNQHRFHHSPGNTAQPVSSQEPSHSPPRRGVCDSLVHVPHTCDTQESSGKMLELSQRAGNQSEMHVSWNAGPVLLSMAASALSGKWGSVLAAVGGLHGSNGAVCFLVLKGASW